LADAAIGDRFRSAAQPFALIDRLQLICALEASIRGDRRRPWHVLRTGDVTAALRALLWKRLGREQLAREFLRRSHVDDLRAVAGHLLEHVVAKRADRGIGSLRSVFAALEGRLLRDERSTLRGPLRAAAVHESHVLMPVVLEEPEEPCGEPVVVIAEDSDGRVLRDTVLR